MSECRNTSIMRVNIFLSILIGSATALVGDEFFVHYMKNFVNQSVPACDNFYRHVCSRNMAPTDRYAGHAVNVLKEYVNEGARILERSRNSTVFEKFLKTFGGSDFITAYYRLPKEVHARYEHTEQIAAGMNLIKVFSSIMQRMHYVTAVPDLSIFAPRQLIHELIELAETELQATETQYRKDTIQEFIKRLATMSTETYDEIGLEGYMDMFEKLDKFFKGTGALDLFDEHNNNTHFKEILSILGKYEPGLLNLQDVAHSINDLPDRITEYNAYNGGNTIGFHDAVFVLTANASIPAKFGSTGSVIGHEMFHSLLRTWNNPDDDRLGSHVSCLETHMQNVCNVFQEGECHSGPITYNEDAPDMEGVQLMYKLMKNKLGGKLQDKIPEIGVTNEQMFFYANAMGSCEQEDDYGKLNHYMSAGTLNWEGHSYAIPRVNGPLSLMKAFHDAFDCKAGDRMFDVAVAREECNAFGEPVRK